MPVLFYRSWDAARGRWTTETPPTIADGVKRFSTNVRQITEDRRTGMVTLAIIWKDREVAAQWANQLVAEADDALRNRAIAEYSRSIEYLTSESATTASVEIRASVYKAMESELKDAMIARTRDAYAFQVLDPAVPRDAKDTDSPNKPLYVALGGIFGLIFGVILAATRSPKKTAV
jgi:LPS O-antigen subunit length determinant protein (WzzB/FepE family)